MNGKPALVDAFAPADFIGAWTVRRTVLDRKAWVTARFAGTLVIGPERFFEEGDTFIGEASFVSRRRYTLDFHGDALALSFADGRPFIQVGAAADQSFTHPCGDDFYAGRLVVRDAKHFAEIWRVVGPRKNYTSIAHFARVERT